MVRASQSFLIVIGLLLGSIFATNTASTGNFLPLKSETLEQQAVQLPQDFQGERNLLFIAFEREQPLPEVQGNKMGSCRNPRNPKIEIRMDAATHPP